MPGSDEGRCERQLFAKASVTARSGPKIVPLAIDVWGWIDVVCASANELQSAVWQPEYQEVSIHLEGKKCWPPGLAG